MRARAVWAVLVVSSALVAQGCDGGENGEGGSGGGGGPDGAGGSGGLDGGGGTGGGGTGGTGGTGGGGGTVGSLEIVIEEFSFSPENLVAPPGATVTVVNRDAVPHSVTSQSAPERYVFGEVDGVSFDTGEFGPGERTITLPDTAASGTVIPYFCLTHTDGMANEGRITVE